MVHDDDSEDSETTLNKQSPQKMKRLGTIADNSDTLISGDGHFGMTSNSDIGAQNYLIAGNDSELSAPLKNFKLVPVEHRLYYKMQV